MQPLTGRPCRQLGSHLLLRQQKWHGRQPRSAPPSQCRMCRRKQGRLRQQLHCQAKQNPDRSGLYEGLGWALGGQQGKLLMLPAHFPWPKVPEMCAACSLALSQAAHYCPMAELS